MSSFFPTPYPDELLYSIITRYHVRSGNKSFKQTLLELLGYSSQQLCNLELPNNLEFLVKHLPVISKHSVESFISSHTLYTFYKIFLVPSEAFLLQDSMRKKTGKPIFQIAKMPVVEKFENRQFLRFCTQCFEEDVQRHGEAYWHRMHQMQGIFVCLAHGTILQESLVPLQEGYLDCHIANSENCPVNGDEVVYEEHTTQKLLDLAKDIAWLSNSNVEFNGLRWLRSRYQHYLVEQRFVSIPLSKSFKFDKRKFAYAIFDYYGQEFWEIVKPGLATSMGQYFAHCLFACDISPVIDRVTHLLLIRFLSNSFNDFFKK